ncbi:MAG: hypothetical protein AseanaTS_00050 [Candidatus Pelagadaptatus aseana]|uniref:hypothetical protein n=1 Tax=Candidatus Pelagadaptatus aseana TaxID=3120508 RepID=UPI0039B25F0A
MNSPKTVNGLRKYHRYLGFFLAGIMAVYAISGVLLVFRNTDVLQYEQTRTVPLAAGLPAQELGKELKIKRFDVIEETPDLVTFAEGSYNKQTGSATVTRTDYPPLLAKMVHLHKATTDSPLFFLNILFGVALLFFSVSAFFMFLWKSAAYKTGLKFAAGGFLLAMIMVAIS